MGNTKLQYAVRAVLAAAAASAVAPAYAQTAPAAVPDTALQEVVVTGSRLAQSPNDVSISPVTSVTSLDIEQTGYVRAEDILNNLPQVIAEQSSGTSISSNGTATVSLRGLGSQRTLVLVNGTRLMPGAGIGPTVSNSPDINQIPADLIERVDVLTGGASAVYGADAVAGVVNFVLNTHFEGVRLDANYGFGMHKNDDQTLLGYLTKAHQPLPDSTINAGFNKDVSFLAGANFADGKGNATVYATYLRSNPAVGYQYDFAGCTLNTPGKLPGKGGLKCGGSSSSATGRFLLLGQTPSSNFATLADRTVDAATGTFRNYTAADSYNYGALSYLQRGAERYTAGAFLNYDMNDHVNVYSEFMFARNTSSANYGPSGLFAFGTPTINCDPVGAAGYNPLLTAGERSVLCSPANVAANQATFGGTGNNITLYLARRSVETGPRIDNYSSNSLREVFGAKGKINDVFSYDVYGQVGITQLQDVEQHFLGTQQINNALQAVVNPKTGLPTCQSVLNGTDPNCVPWNIYTPGGVTAAQLKYLTVPSSFGITAKEYIADASVTADLGKYGMQIPTASSGLSVNVGAEYRQENYDFDPDYIFQNGFASGGNGAQNAIHGAFHVAEGFAEARLPILNDKPGAYILSTEFGFRYSNYTSGFSTNTFKVGMEWAPIKDARLRAGFNRAVRAPAVGDLFAPAVIGAGGTADPCWGPAVGGLVNGHDLAFCAKTGVTAAEFGHILPNPAAQINTSLGGNPGLTPEIADTYTYGVVFQPTFVPRLVMSVDYYRIVIKSTITSLTSNTVVNNCGITGSAALCGLIHRGVGTGSLWFNNTNFVDTREVNIGHVSTQGLDLAAHYSFDVGPAGKLGLNVSGSRALNFLTQPLPTGGAYDCVGYFGTTCGAPTPAWRHTVNTSWMAPWAGLDITARWRYLGPVTSDRVSQDPQLKQTYFAPTSHIGGYSYFDFSASIPLPSTGVSFRFGVNNVADKRPPIVANGNYSDCPNLSCNDNTWVGTYDTLGRYLYAHVQAKF